MAPFNRRCIRTYSISQNSMLASRAVQFGKIRKLRPQLSKIVFADKNTVLSLISNSIYSTSSSADTFDKLLQESDCRPVNYTSDFSKCGDKSSDSEPNSVSLSIGSKIRKPVKQRPSKQNARKYTRTAHSKKCQNSEAPVANQTEKSSVHASHIIDNNLSIEKSLANKNVTFNSLPYIMVKECSNFQNQKNDSKCNLERSLFMYGSAFLHNIKHASTPKTTLRPLRFVKMKKNGDSSKLKKSNLSVLKHPLFELKSMATPALDTSSELFCDGSAADDTRSQPLPNNGSLYSSNVEQGNKSESIVIINNTNSKCGTSQVILSSALCCNADANISRGIASNWKNIFGASKSIATNIKNALICDQTDDYVDIKENLNKYSNIEFHNKLKFCSRQPLENQILFSNFNPNKCEQPNVPLNENEHPVQLSKKFIDYTLESCVDKTNSSNSNRGSQGCLDQVQHNLSHKYYTRSKDKKNLSGMQVLNQNDDPVQPNKKLIGNTIESCADDTNSDRSNQISQRSQHQVEHKSHCHKNYTCSKDKKNLSVVQALTQDESCILISSSNRICLPIIIPHANYNTNDQTKSSMISHNVVRPGKLYRRSMSIVGKRAIAFLPSVKCEPLENIDENNDDLPAAVCAQDKQKLCWRRSLYPLMHASLSPINASLEESLSNLSLDPPDFPDPLVPYNTTTDPEKQQTQVCRLSIDPSNVCPFRCSQAGEIVLIKCGQDQPLAFEDCYPPSVLKNCFKLGEGVFGEVFLRRLEDGGTCVMKVIPIEGHQEINGTMQKKFDEILSEILIATELSNLRENVTNQTHTFNEVQRVRCVQGAYPQRLIELWELYAANKVSENDSPEILTNEQQLYIVLELTNGGCDLESYKFNNARQAYSVIQQLSFAIAVAERQLNFEHRDLHWGNVLLRSVPRTHCVTFVLDGEAITVHSYGVEVTIIDFTLSRIQADGVVVYNDLSTDKELFSATGDYQFEVYRMMQQETGNNWEVFMPKTNIYWLHYILDKAVKGFQYTKTNTKVHREYMQKIRKLKNIILSYDSVNEFVVDFLK